MLGRRVFAEFLGTAFLLIAVIGSGIAAARLSAGNSGLELLENAAATAAALVAIIFALGPVSGAHLNPIVTLTDRALGGVSTPDSLAYIGAQLAGGVVGAILANLMFSLPAVEISTKARTGGGLLLGEVLATFGLVLLVFGVVRTGRAFMAPLVVGAYIGGAYFFTSSTSFANPAATIARSLSNTFAGIKPSSVPAFVVAEFIGAALALVAVLILFPVARPPAKQAALVNEEEGRP